MISRLDKKRDGFARADVKSSGQVRVLVVGDSGVGKTSLVHLILNGMPHAKPRRTVGCSVEVKHVTYFGGRSSEVGSERNFFVEIWDVSGHERYKDCRSIFYSDINGVIFVYDQTQKRTKENLRKWAAEVASSGTFSAPMPSFSAAGIPVPYLVIKNKSDISQHNSGSSGNLVDLARHWVGKKSFLSAEDELPLTESFPGSGGLIASATEGLLDMDAVGSFFQSLVKRRYFVEENAHTSLTGWTVNSYNSSHSRGRSLQEDDFESEYTRI